jgi:hypothetical protein
MPTLGARYSRPVSAASSNLWTICISDLTIFIKKFSLKEHSQKMSAAREEIMKSHVSVRLHSDEATQDSGKVRLGDMAPSFDGASRQPGGKKAAHDAATEDSGKVRLGDMAPLF